MTLLEKLQAHRGGLIRLKTELYWYGGRGYDDNPGRICLVLDAEAAFNAGNAPAIAMTWKPRAQRRRAGRSAALLLIDGSPQWIWVDESDVEVLG